MSNFKQRTVSLPNIFCSDLYKMRMYVMFLATIPRPSHSFVFIHIYYVYLSNSSNHKSRVHSWHSLSQSQFPPSRMSVGRQ